MPRAVSAAATYALSPAVEAAVDIPSETAAPPVMLSDAPSPPVTAPPMAPNSAPLRMSPSVTAEYSAPTAAPTIAPPTTPATAAEAVAPNAPTTAAPIAATNAMLFPLHNFSDAIKRFVIDDLVAVLAIKQD